MKIFCTGMSGYIGRNLVRALNDEGCTYVNFDLVDGYDIGNIESVHKYMRGCDAAVHLAALPNVGFCESHPMKAIEVNVVGTRNVAWATGKLKMPLVYASTMAALNPQNIYGLTKRIGEKFVLDAGGVVLRFANIYGGVGFLDRRSAMCNFVNAMNRGERATIYGDGSADRDFIHIEDVCRAIIVAIKAPPGIYEICTRRETSILELAELIGVKYEFAPPRREPSEEGDKYILDWEAKVKLEDGLKRLIE